MILISILMYWAGRGGNSRELDRLKKVIHDHCESFDDCVCSGSRIQELVRKAVANDTV